MFVFFSPAFDLSRLASFSLPALPAAPVRPCLSRPCLPVSEHRATCFPAHAYSTSRHACLGGLVARTSFTRLSIRFASLARCHHRHLAGSGFGTAEGCGGKWGGGEDGGSRACKKKSALMNSSEKGQAGSRGMGCLSSFVQCYSKKKYFLKIFFHRQHYCPHLIKPLHRVT